MNIVELNSSHRAALIELICSVATEHVLPHLSSSGRQYYLSKLIPDIDYCFAIESGRYVGVIGNEGLIGACGFSTTGHIAQLFVQSSEHAKGIGSSLLNHAISQCDADKITVNASINSVSYYRRQGFETIGEEKNIKGVLFLPMARINS